MLPRTVNYPVWGFLRNKEDLENAEFISVKNIKEKSLKRQ